MPVKLMMTEAKIKEAIRKYYESQPQHLKIGVVDIIVDYNRYHEPIIRAEAEVK
jgi:hypothetical protein